MQRHKVSGKPASSASGVAPGRHYGGQQTPPHHALSQRAPAGRCTRTEPACHPGEGLSGLCPGKLQVPGSSHFPRGALLLPSVSPKRGLQMLRALKADSQHELELHSQLEPGSKECSWEEKQPWIYPGETW